MRALFTVVVAVALSAAASFAVVSRTGPDTADLDRDIAFHKAQLAEAKSEAARYTGGVIAIETGLRVAILDNTVAMLQQKRASYLRGISLAYTDLTPRISSADDGSSAELAKARAEATSARMEAARYSGGLIQTMALLREATAKVTEVSIEQRIALAKAGIPMPALPVGPAAAAPAPGKTTTDKDAL